VRSTETENPEGVITTIVLDAIHCTDPKIRIGSCASVMVAATVSSIAAPRRPPITEGRELTGGA
jgi:hypothetical protein